MRHFFLFLTVFITVFSLDCNLCGAEANSVRDERYSKLPPVAAIVNGEKITVEMLVAELEKEFPPSTVPPEQEIFNRQLDKALDTLISAMLLRQFFKSENITVSDEELALYRKNLPSESRDAAGRDAASDRLAAAGEKYFRLHTPDKTAVSDAEIETYYRRNQLKFKKKAQTSFSLIAVERSVPDAGKKAAAIREKIIGGAPFEDFTTAAAVPEQEAVFAAAFASGMNVGEISPVIARPELFMVIRCDKHIPASFTPLSQVSPAISGLLRAGKLAAALSGLLSDLTGKAQIQKKTFSELKI